MARVSTHDELAAALEPCGAVMEAIVEDADAKAACYRDMEAVVGSDVLLWSATSNFPMTRLAAEHGAIPNGPSWSIPCRRS